MVFNEWTVNYLTISRIVSSGEGEDAVAQLEMVTSSAGMPADDPALEELLDSLLVESFRKKPDTGETCSCKIYTFQQTPAGAEDRQLMTEALSASSLKLFQAATRRMAGRYLSLPGARPGLLIFLNVRVTPKKGQGGTFFVMFINDFEDIRRFDPHSGVLELVPDAVGRRCRKALVYPVFNGYEMDENQVKIIQEAKKTGALADLFYIEAPRTTKELLEEELRRAIMSRPEGDRYDEYFRREAPKERELFGEERYINFSDLMPVEEIEHLSRASFQSAMENHGKQAKVRIVIDEGVKFEGRLDRMGVNYFFARKGDQKYLIIKGEHFLTKSQLNSVEFLDVEDLDEVIPRLKNGD